MIVSLISYCGEKVHYRRLFLCCHTQQIHSTLNYTQWLYVVLGHLVALFTVTHQWINGCCCISVRGKLPARAGWAWYTDVMSLTAILSFRVSPVMSDEPQQTLQVERERAAGRGSDGRVHGRDTSERHHSNWRQLAAAWAAAAGYWDWHAAVHLHRHWPQLTQSGEMARYRVQFMWAVISLSLGEGEMRGCRLNEVNNVLENLFWGNWWRDWRDNEGRDNEVRLYWHSSVSLGEGGRLPWSQGTTRIAR